MTTYTQISHNINTTRQHWFSHMGTNAPCCQGQTLAFCQQEVLKLVLTHGELAFLLKHWVLWVLSKMAVMERVRSLRESEEGNPVRSAIITSYSYTHTVTISTVNNVSAEPLSAVFCSCMFLYFWNEAMCCIHHLLTFENTKCHKKKITICPLLHKFSEDLY